ncbi:colanic acid biosynthesis glycosyltransferase WcaI [Parapedobacter defluvii]|uniref:Colanic acid biosynthesis glycosyltransferase WcaI n=1 Tax=Parapedobacter defluvii TaxID=2045106 RepID=A0ABQ1MUS3_9SPHI|nr:WcaI family glycosyltransferase [Parapedobacter defluvii]RQP19033.1 MAG: colanic acid biosynthesis glycosyltransferase WcaI [Parapedobacter sp.]GGC45290.1 colanic acid biosynthesis glycosyltransferase WcaI [Parapedobacter defluvii]
MRILIFGINYSPELTGIGKYTGEMGAWFAARGHDVAVVTAKPYYPEWEIHQTYKGTGWLTEQIAGVTVYRVPLYVPKNVTAKKRILHEFSFLAAVLPKWFGLLLKKRYDIVINITPPFHLGFLAFSYAKLRGIKLITHIQDLQVDAAKELGMINNKKALDVLFKAEKYLLDKSHAVSSISLGMKKKILAKGVPESKYIMFPNWVDEGVIKPLTKENSLRNEWGIPMEDKVVLYSGNLGEKQGLEVIIDAAEQFKDKSNVHFVICGSGGARDRLEEMADRAGLRQVRFYPLQPYEKLPALLATADIHLVLQKKSASDLVMPSKLTGILAAGGCAIVSAVQGTSLHDVMRTHQLGILIEPESAKALIAGLQQALHMDLTPFRERARRYAERFLSKEQLLKEFERHLVKLTTYEKQT